jgi:hypothetical protein
MAVEATRADAVKVTPARTKTVARCCTTKGLTKGSPGCRDEKKKKKVMLKRAPGVTEQPSALETVDVMPSGGIPLPAPTRSLLEARFGHDFSAVRVHSDSPSDGAASALGARAYTIGHDVYFAAGHFRPETPEGRRLLAHELVHTIQQRGATALQPSGVIEPADSALEREADRVAGVVAAGGTARVAGRAPAVPLLQEAQEGARATAVRPIEGGRVQVIRTLRTQPCRRVPETRTTPAGDMLYWDADANAVGIRFNYCRGGGTAEVDSSIRYGNLVNAAQDFAGRVGSAIVAGRDPGAEIERLVREGTIGGRVFLGVTVSGTLRLELTGTTEQGMTRREYEVTGLFRFTPRGGWRLEIAGGVRHTEDVSGTVTAITFTPRVNIGSVQVGAEIERTEERPAGGPARTTTTYGGRLSVPIRGRFGVGAVISGSTEGGVNFQIVFGTVDRSQRVEDVPRVDCHVCDCPPALPQYSCTRIIDPHTVPVTIQEAGRELVQLHYAYDSDAPEQPDVYARRVESISSLVGNNYEPQYIHGFASPEDNVADNLRLAQRRADRARGDIATRLQNDNRSATLPPAEGRGELIGEGRRGREAHDDQLIRTLSERLRALDENQQLELLGIDPATAGPAEREDARRRITAFLDGREEGRALGQRARWEKIFPFLRRVDVEMKRRKITGEMRVPELRTPTDCDAETIEWAEQTMPKIPPGARVPTSSGRC